MIRVRYTGPDPRLQGQTALAQVSGDATALCVLFDDKALPEADDWQLMPVHHFQLAPQLAEVAA